ncbi:hypothetical protein [Streptomyces sp. AM 2-1-1]|uniref:hypothetical protein n=1 Tax=Streptomyces sp. AM 2-1-1 TaxID=3028709 RepID=UPI0023BA16AD|nr:hypothetical protein [Streptomyces sp. AM 2-1-1]WEH44011.1 hypothetical protein PZB77_31115 [Streptomyces sp. AM 2-1-1]
MFTTTVPPKARPSGPEAVIITVVVLFVTVLILTGMKPVNALLVTGSAGIFGALAVRACTTTKLSALLRPAMVELRAASS